MRSRRNRTNSTDAVPGFAYETEIREVEVAKLRPHPANDYSMDEGDIRTLADNIEQVGLVELPFLRVVADGGLQIISGHRRVRALKLLAQKDPRWAKCQARVAVGMSDADALLVLHSANIFRPVSKEERLRQTENLKREIAQLRRGREDWRGVPTDTIIASMLGLSTNVYKRQTKVAKELDDGLYRRYADGSMGIYVAYDLARQDKGFQERFRDYVEERDPKTPEETTKVYESFTRSVGSMVRQLDRDLDKVRTDIVEIRGMVRDGAERDEADIENLEAVRAKMDRLVAEIRAAGHGAVEG